MQKKGEGHEFQYHARSLRVEDKVWEQFKLNKSKYVTWNRFIKHLNKLEDKC